MEPLLLPPRQVDFDAAEENAAEERRLAKRKANWIMTIIFCIGIILLIFFSYWNHRHSPYQRRLH